MRFRYLGGNLQHYAAVFLVLLLKSMILRVNNDHCLLDKQLLANTFKQHPAQHA
jgi:hypothetical protein